ncbi:MAG TPA: SRPBCC domain-containing protein [Flavobacteriales bacterium]|nr:SRPBCC domain-containing protein [Flavobacteriales bacterium]
MNEYIFLITNAHGEKAGWGKDKQDLYKTRYEAYLDKLMSNSQLILAQPVATECKIISKVNGAFIETDHGNQVETLVGYYHIATTDLDKAVEIAKRHPEFEFSSSASIEIRQIKPSQSINGLAHPKAYGLNDQKLKSNVLKKSIEINKTPQEVWRALTDSEKIKIFFFGTECTSDWKKGSPITYRGIWQGKPYEDKGNILDVEEGKFIYYNYWSSFSGLEDKPENYKNIRYDLANKGGKTLFTVEQDGFVDQRTYDHSSENWDIVMGRLKKMLEEN